MEELSTRFGEKEGRENVHLGDENSLHTIADGVSILAYAQQHATHAFIRR